MIIKPNSWEIKPIESSDLLVGLSCQFRIANEQSVKLLLHTYKTEAYQGAKTINLLGVQHLEILVKSVSDSQWEQWANIPLGYSSTIMTGYIDLMRQYLGVRTINLATTSVGVRSPNLVGGDSVIVLASTVPVDSLSVIPDDYLPF